MFRTKKQHVLPFEIEVDHPLNSIISRENIIERLGEHGDLQAIPNFQRVTISGEETSGVQNFHFM